MGLPAVDDRQRTDLESGRAASVGTQDSTPQPSKIFQLPMSCTPPFRTAAPCVFIEAHDPIEDRVFVAIETSRPECEFQDYFLSVLFGTGGRSASSPDDLNLPPHRQWTGRIAAIKRKARLFKNSPARFEAVPATVFGFEKAADRQRFKVVMGAEDAWLIGSMEPAAAVR